MRVEWSRRALDQLREIFDYIVRDRPHVAAEIVDGLFDATSLLAGTPEMVRSGGGARRRISGSFSSRRTASSTGSTRSAR